MTGSPASGAGKPVIPVFAILLDLADGRPELPISRTSSKAEPAQIDRLRGLHVMSLEHDVWVSRRPYRPVPFKPNTIGLDA
jgi:hypothetical protein